MHKKIYMRKQKEFSNLKKRNTSEEYYIVHARFSGSGIHWTITECDVTYRANGYNEAN